MHFRETSEKTKATPPVAFSLSAKFFREFFKPACRTPSLTCVSEGVKEAKARYARSDSNSNLRTAAPTILMGIAASHTLDFRKTEKFY